MTSPMAGMRFRQRSLSCLLLLLYLSACTSWQVGSPTPAQFVANEKPRSVRVTRADGSTFDLRSPVVRGDSLVGTVGGGMVREDSLRTVSVPLSEVQGVAVRKVSAGNTLLLLGIGLGALFVAGCAGSNSAYVC